MTSSICFNRRVALLHAALLVALLGLALPAVAAGADYAPQQVIVDYAANASAEQRAALRQELGVTEAQGLVGGHMVVYKVAEDMPVPAAAQRARDKGFVEAASPDYILTTDALPNDPELESQWGLRNFGQEISGSPGVPGTDIGAAKAWDVTTGSDSMLIAVIDTGINYTHPDLASRIAINPGEYGAGKQNNGIDDDEDGFVDNWRGWDFVGEDNDATDTGGHGTAMAGIAAASGNDGIGITGAIQNARILPLRAGEDTTLLTSRVSAAINYAAQKGAKVVNMSFSSESDAGWSAITNNPQILFVAAAGNYGSNSKRYPCAIEASNLLCVAAITHHNVLAGFSNYGPSWVDLGAPGSEILSTTWDGIYRWETGTSPATAITSGAAALVRVAHPGWTPSEVIDRILETTDPVPTLQGKVATGGRINVGKALDLVAPTVTITKAPAALTNERNPVVEFTSSEEGVEFQCRVNAGAWLSCQSGVKVTTTLDGPYSFSVRARDEADNVGEPTTIVFTLDTVPPSTEITSGPAPIEASSGASFAYDSTEPGSFECRIDDDAWAACPWGKISYSGLADGPRTFYVRAVDQAGNADPTSPQWSWIVNAQAPRTTITARPPNLSNQDQASFDFNASEPSSFECRIDGGGWLPCSSGVSYADLADGSHVFEVRATDSAGTVEEQPPSVSWTVDTVAPTVSILSGPPARAAQRTVTLTYASEPGATFQCRLDDAVFVPCPDGGAVTYRNLAATEHAFEVRATDQAGNTGSAARWSFEILAAGAAGAKRPKTRLLRKPPRRSSKRVVVFRLAGGVRYRYKLDGKRWRTTRRPVIRLRVKPGKHELRAVAINAAGVADPRPIKYRFRTR